MIVLISFAVYLLLVLVIGLSSLRFFRGTGEDFSVAGRGIGAFVLLMTLFGTHMTAFSLLGASAEAFRQGIGVFALMASSSALVAPAIFFFVGTRIWQEGKRHGHLTPIAYFRHRFQSPALGLLLFATFLVFLIPYVLIGVMGAGLTLAQMSDGAVPGWVGSAAVCVVIFIYVSGGGMRGTAWANTFQTLVFMVFGAITFVVITRALGGMESALAKVAELKPQLLLRGEALSPYKMATYALIPLSVGMFPHIFIHWLTAKKAGTFKPAIVFYPLCIAIVWIPSVLLGVMAAGAYPDLTGPATNGVLVRLVAEHAPGLMGGILAAGVFAAIMSSLDSQILALSNMFTHDIVKCHFFKQGMTEEKQVLWGRIFVAATLLLVFVLAQITDRSIFRLGIWSFSGFAALFPLLPAALYWPRVSAKAATLATLVTLAAWSFFFFTQPQWPLLQHIMPVTFMLAANLTALVLGTLLWPQVAANPADP